MSDINFDNVKKVYFIGIGGIGMSAVARMFSLAHKEIFGSDLSVSEITSELQKRGAQIFIGAPEKNRELPEGIDLVIYTVAIPDDHPELLAARAKHIPAISYPESLAIISKDKFTIAVAGTHGKTTTTGMIAQILIEAGLDPTVIIGSLLRGHDGEKSNFIAGKSKYFVVEACEYKRSFLNLKPDIAVVTNIDEDHLDYYKDLQGIQQGFGEFLGLLKNGGVVVTDSTDEKVKPVLDPAQAAHFASGNVRVVDYNTNAGMDPASASSVAEKIILKIPGKHNIQNAKAALAVARELGIPEEKALTALANFSGTWRRFEDKGETKNGVLVYDDYAHHPSEIAATLQAAREKFSQFNVEKSQQEGRRLVVAFQPHLYSRTKEHFEEFADAFALADEVLLLPIYAAREAVDPSVSSELLAQKIPQNKAKYVENFAAVAEYVKKNLKKGDIFFTMGAGDITKLSDIVLN